MHLGVAAQEEAHRQELLRALPVAWQSRVRIETHASPAALGYRARARLHARVSGGRAIIGIHEIGTHEPVEVDACVVLAPKLDAARRALEPLLEGAHGRGDLSLAMGKAAPVLEMRWSGALTAAIYARLERAVMGGEWAGARVWEGEASRPAVIGDPTPWMRGADGAPLRLAPGGFGQASEDANAALVRAVADLVERAGPREQRRVVELYAGAGNLTIALAPLASDLVAVESSREACEAARANLSQRGLEARVVEADAATYALGPAARLVVLDPPRTGARGVVERIAKVKPRHVLYVSCDAQTLGRDLAVLERLYEPRALLVLRDVSADEPRRKRHPPRAARAMKTLVDAPPPRRSRPLRAPLRLRGLRALASGGRGLRARLSRRAAKRGAPSTATRSPFARNASSASSDPFAPAHAAHAGAPRARRGPRDGDERQHPRGGERRARLDGPPPRALATGSARTLERDRARRRSRASGRGGRQSSPSPASSPTRSACPSASPASTWGEAGISRRARERLATRRCARPAARAARLHRHGAPRGRPRGDRPSPSSSRSRPRGPRCPSRAVGRFLRPFIRASRPAIRRAHGPPRRSLRDGPFERRPAFLRVRVRQELLPLGGAEPWRRGPPLRACRRSHPHNIAAFFRGWRSGASSAERASCTGRAGADALEDDARSATRRPCGDLRSDSGYNHRRPRFLARIDNRGHGCGQRSCAPGRARARARSSEIDEPGGRC